MESTAPKPFVFVLMPFGPEFDDVYQLGIKAACQEAGTNCERLDEQIFTENMLAQIYSQILEADIIVADMTGRNPNVFYEVGYARASNKTVVLLAQSSADIPFDLLHYQHIVYSGSIVDLKSRLTEKIRKFSKLSSTGHTKSQTGFLFYNNDTLMTDGCVVKLQPRPYDHPVFSIKIQNISDTLLEPDNYKICLQIPSSVSTNVDWLSSTTVFVDKLAVEYYSCDSKIFPGQWVEYKISIGQRDLDDKMEYPCEVQFSILCAQYSKRVNFTVLAPVEVEMPFNEEVPF